MDKAVLTAPRPCLRCRSAYRFYEKLTVTTQASSSPAEWSKNCPTNVCIPVMPAGKLVRNSLNMKSVLWSYVRYGIDFIRAPSTERVKFVPGLLKSVLTADEAVLQGVCPNPCWT